ncbi:MAG: aminoglycoside phosphotransferase family protein [Ruminococcaceae bacterium]|nr:aminoglycoside phosphotransferase family protein [Oscillospiraceae bacterium]
MENKDTALKISEITSKFGITGAKNIEVCHIGHINGTFFADSSLGRIVVQKINKGIFTDPPSLMDNIIAVTKHIRKKMESEGASNEEISRGVLEYFPAFDGKYYITDSSGEYWRISKFIDSTRTYDAGTPELLTESGYSFGKFQSYLSDFPAETLTETIPFFHDTAVRFAHFEKTVAADLVSRAAKCPDLIEKVLSYKETAGKIVAMLASGDLPLRVTHNDTKINNVLIDTKTKKGVCVVDLDTVMPGTFLYDFGDAIRSGASAVPEGSLEFDKFVVREDLYKAFYEGFSRGVGNSITKIEEENLPLGAFMMTYEVGMRFLDDYLSGDTYFHTEYAEHNLDRARGQLLLADDIMKKKDSLLALTKKL